VHLDGSVLPALHLPVPPAACQCRGCEMRLPAPGMSDEAADIWVTGDTNQTSLREFSLL
jgi:hypothetical protein